MSTIPLQTFSSAADTVSVRVNHLLFINRRFNQTALADRLGLSRSTVSQKLAGVTRWNVDEIVTIARTFEVSTDYLFGLEPIESATPNSSLVGRTGLEPVTDGL